jgi:porin
MVSAASAATTATDLQHHRWVLESVNGNPAPTGDALVPELDFGEQMTVSGNTGCNRFNGKAVLRNGRFLIESMASTRRLCDQPANELENTLVTLLGSESDISIDADRKLTLSAAGTVAVFALQDWVAAAQGTGASRESRFGFTAQRSPPFGGPTSPAGELEDADRKETPAFRFPAADEAFRPWNDWKTNLNKEKGVQLSAHYSTMYQSLSETIGTDDKASAGVFRGTLKWTPVGRGTANEGSLNVMLDHRHGFRDVPPASLAGQAGYIGVTSLFYADTGFAVINLNWQNGFNEGRTGLIAGRYDPNDYMNVLGYVNPWTIFANLAINLDASIALPDSSWGVGAGHWINDHWYVLGGINDANGVGTDDLEFFDGGAEFFKYAHIGWSPSKDERYFKNVHVMTWHVDERTDLGVPSSHGIAFAANWTFDERWMPFARLGFSKGAAPIYNESITLGLIRKFQVRSDLVGVAANWGSSPDNSLKDQTTIEAFWRFQFSQSFAITPSLQLLIDPALNPVEDSVWVLGLRARLAF